MNEIRQENWHDVPVYTMENDQLIATLCPSIGNNLIRIWDKTKNREVLRVPADPGVLLQSPIHYGTPLLMPPNRIKNGSFQYRETTYQFEVNKPDGNHIHGVIKDQPWNVISTSTDEDGCTIVSTFATTDFPHILAQYPHDLVFEMTYILKGSTLQQKATVTNRGNDTAPFGFGLHTWFMIDGEPEKWTFQLPVEGIWELNDELMPTGTILPLGQYEALKHGLNLKGLDLDTVFHIGDNQPVAIMSRDDCEIRYIASDLYKHWVIYTKGEADEIICPEPYTWVTNAPNLDLPASLTGLLEVASGESLQLDVTLDIIYK